MTDRHILITGGAGYIGSLLTSELLRQNYRVTLLDSLLFGGESVLPFLSHPNFHFIKSDVTEPRAVRDAVKRDWQKPDAVVHLAGIVGFPACQAVGRQVAWKYNVEATKLVFEQSADLGVERFVFASTYSNYGLSEDGKPVTEEYAAQPAILICGNEDRGGGISAVAEKCGLCAAAFPLCNAVWNFPAHPL